MECASDNPNAKTKRVIKYKNCNKKNGNLSKNIRSFSSSHFGFNFGEQFEHILKKYSLKIISTNQEYQIGQHY